MASAGIIRSAHISPRHPLRAAELVSIPHTGVAFASLTSAMQQRTPIEELPSQSCAAVLGFDVRLERGPLRVRTLWGPHQARALAKNVLNRRKARVLKRLAAGAFAVCAALSLVLLRR